MKNKIQKRKQKAHKETTSKRRRSTRGIFPPTSLLFTFLDLISIFAFFFQIHQWLISNLITRRLALFSTNSHPKLNQLSHRISFLDGPPMATRLAMEAWWASPCLVLPGIPASALVLVKTMSFAAAILKFVSPYLSPFSFLFYGFRFGNF